MRCIGLLMTTATDDPEGQGRRWLIPHLKIAKALGFIIPISVLGRADETWS
jgi:hypothetical protein